MSEIARQLRLLSADRDNVPPFVRPALLIAADEIDRLEAEVAQLRANRSIEIVNGESK